ncbi:MAG: glycosyltransferase family 2 protein [Candidatus Omnitrophica bacterium]|nr:glycosyltransferase family 2 protein [Candidatus Omnitrophota bacterium]
MPVYNQPSYTKACLDSIKKHTDYPHRIVVVDDASSSETAEYLDKLSNENEIVLLRNQENLGWVRSVNKGLNFSKAQYVCVMNNDTVVYPGWLSEMVSVALKNAAFGLVNPEWEIPEKFKGSREDYFRIVIKKQNGKFIETDWVRGFCFLIKRAVIEKIGGLDQIFSPGYFDDWDYSLRAIQAGFLVVKAQGAFVWHYKNVTHGQLLKKKGLEQEIIQKKGIFCNRWGKFQKALLIVDRLLKGKSGNLEESCFCLLRKQVRLVVIKGRLDFNLHHANYFVITSSDYFLKARVLFHLWRNFLLKPGKRYDYVICSLGMKNFLERFGVVSKRYIIKDVEEELLKETVPLRRV